MFLQIILYDSRGIIWFSYLGTTIGLLKCCFQLCILSGFGLQKRFSTGVYHLKIQIKPVFLSGQITKLYIKRLFKILVWLALVFKRTFEGYFYVN